MDTGRVIGVIGGSITSIDFVINEVRITFFTKKESYLINHRRFSVPCSDIVVLIDKLYDHNCISKDEAEMMLTSISVEGDLRDKRDTILEKLSKID